MRAIAVTPAKKSVDLIDHPAPTIQSATDVRLRMLEVGICGTDREICSFEYGAPPAGSPYLVIGHESLGEVVEVGPQATGVKVGDLVVPMVRRPCSDPNCLACRAARQDFCFSGQFTERGIKEQHGFLTQEVVDDVRYMNVVPSALREVAVLVEPLTIAEKGLIQLWQVQQRLPWTFSNIPGELPGRGHRAVVLGAGPVGLLGAMALIAAGFETCVYSRSPAPNPKAALVESIGGKYISSETTPSDDLPKMIGNIDVIYEAVGASSLAFDVMRFLGTNGVFIFTGVPGRKAPILVDTDLIMRDLVLKNQVVFGTVNASKDAYAAAIRDIGLFNQRWPAALRSLITGRFPMEQYKDLLLGKAEGIKNVFAIG